jgi:hypothetical protein
MTWTKWIVNLKKIRMPRAYYPGKPDNQCRWMMRETRDVLRSLLLMTGKTSGNGELAILIREAVCHALKLYLFWDGSLELYSPELADQIIADPAEQIQQMDWTEKKQTMFDDIEAFRAMSASMRRKRRGREAGGQHR